MKTLLEPNETQAYLDLAVQVQYAARRLMKARGVTQSELARRMGLSRSRVSQFFGDYPNISLETLACIFFALGEQDLEVTSPGIRELP